MKYKCIVLDHDDTVVDSTRQIHYPSFMSFLKHIRPNFSITFEEYMWKNFHPGFSEFCFGELKFTEAEMDREVAFWREYVKNHIPVAYDGFRELLHRYKREGGIICVVSHSLSENILRDYEKNGLPIPDEIYGWDRPAEQRKPSPYPIFQIMEKYGLNSREIIMIDDLKPGYDMAKKCEIDFAAAGWAYELSEIKDFMRKYSDFYLEDVKSLSNLIFE